MFANVFCYVFRMIPRQQEQEQQEQQQSFFLDLWVLLAVKKLIYF